MLRRTLSFEVYLSLDTTPMSIPAFDCPHELSPFAKERRKRLVCKESSLFHWQAVLVGTSEVRLVW